MLFLSNTKNNRQSENDCTYFALTKKNNFFNICLWFFQESVLNLLTIKAKEEKNRQTYGYVDKTYAKPLFMNCFINGGITL